MLGIRKVGSDGCDGFYARICAVSWTCKLPLEPVMVHARLMTFVRISRLLRKPGRPAGTAILLNLHGPQFY